MTNTQPDSHMSDADYAEPENPNVLTAIVHGRVQGVGFRVFVRAKAQRLGLTGWVRNLADGTVEVYAEGEEDVLTELLTELFTGPVISRVDNVDVRWLEADPQHQGFRITG